MHRTSALFAAVLTLIASAPAAASGDLSLRWNACASDGGVSDITFPCASGPGGAASALLTFTPPGAIPDFVALDFYVDVGADAAALPDFWSFASVLEPSNCNPGLGAYKDRPVPGCASAADPWDAGTQVVVGYITNLFGTPWRGRIIGSVFRSPDNPTALSAATEYFGVEIRILADAAIESGGGCSGCSTPMVLGPSGVNLGTLSLTWVLSGALDACITAGGSSLPCDAVPARNRTWGQLKAMYR